MIPPTNNTLYFILGERRRVYLSVRLSGGEPFKLSNAVWDLTSYGETEAQGECDIQQQEDNSYILLCTIQPRERKNYVLRYTYSLGEEIRKAEANINVR